MKPNNVTAIIIDKDKPNVITICAVGVNICGNNPKILDAAISKKIDKTKGKYFWPGFPRLSCTTERIFACINSIIDCHWLGINFSPLNNNPNINTPNINISEELVKVINRSPQKACIVINLTTLNWSKYAVIIFFVGIVFLAKSFL